MRHLEAAFLAAAALAAVLIGTAPSAWGQSAVTAAPTALSPAVSARLRQALPLPTHSLFRRMSNSIGVDFSPARGFHMALGAEMAEARPRAALLRRSLTGQARDASSYALLGRYDDFLGEAAQKKQDDKEAAALYARQATSRSLPRAEREQALVAESRVLGEAGRGPDAKRKLSQALRMRPQAWRLWAALGEAQEEDAQAKAAGTTRPGAAAQALRLDQEAQTDYDRAVNLAPKQGMAYALRGDFDGDHQFLRDELRHPGQTPLFGAVAPAVLADFQQAARLLPQPYAIAYPVWTELSTEGFFKLHLPFPSLAAWHTMPAGVRSDTLDAIQRLTRLSQGTGPVARQADVALGFLLFESQRKTAPAEAVLRQGLSGQEQEAAAEMLMHILSMGQYQALAAFCLNQARRRNTPRLHLIAAWAETKQSHWAQAKVQVEKAQVLEPGDATDLLLLAALSLKEEGAPSLVEGKLLLERAGEGLTHAPQLNLPPDEREEYLLIHAYFLALSGDSGAAERELRSVLAVDPQNVGAANGLAILAGPSS